MKSEKITIYTSSIFGVRKAEGTLLRIGKKDYAQYRDCPYVHFIPKGKRKPDGVMGTYQPYIVVLKGHGHPDPQSPFTEPKRSESGLIVRTTRMSCYHDDYKIEFDEMIKPIVEKAEVLMDVRHTVGTSNVTIVN